VDFDPIAHSFEGCVAERHVARISGLIDAAGPRWFHHEAIATARLIVPTAAKATRA
jgi:hypothetical protein